jgi:hypothetical protein
MKIRDMPKKQRGEYYRKKIKEWRLKNPERNKELRKKYKQSSKGRLANLRYARKYEKTPEFKEKMRDYMKEYIQTPKIKQRRKEYIKNYIKRYLENEENHRKFLVRQKDNRCLRKGLIKNIGFCNFCGSKTDLEMHHLSYDESKNVILLCRKCHRELHRKQKSNGGKTNGYN